MMLIFEGNQREGRGWGRGEGVFIHLPAACADTCHSFCGVYYFVV